LKADFIFEPVLPEVVPKVENYFLTPFMKLTFGEKAILEGDQGQVMSKVIRTLVLYGEALQADRLIPIGYFSYPFCIPGVGIRLEILNELVDTGLKIEQGFTLDPWAPLDFENVFFT